MSSSPSLSRHSVLASLGLCVAACAPEPPAAPSPSAPVVVEAPQPVEATLRERIAAVEPEALRPRLVRSWAAGEVSAITLGIQGGVALAGTRDGEVTRWLLPEALLEQRWHAPPEGERGSVVAVGLWWSRAWAVWQQDDTLRLVDLSQGRQIGALPVSAGELSAVVFPREQDWLLLALADGGYARWTPPEAEIERLDAPPQELDPVAEDERWRAVGLGSDIELATRGGSGVAVRTLRAAPAALAADGRTLLGLHDGRLSLWHTDAPTALEVWQAAAPATDLALSPDGRLLAVAAGEGPEIRDSRTGLPLIPVFEPGALAGWSPFGSGDSGGVETEGFLAAARSSDGRWLYTITSEGFQLMRWDLDPQRQGRMLDTRLDRMLRADPYSPDALLARAELAALSARWSRCADLLGLAEQVGAAVHPADQLRALCLAGRLGGARELLARLSPRMTDDPAVQAWAAWLAAQP